MSISRVMAIPRRKVQARVDSPGLGRLDKLFHHISFPILPRASNDRVISVFGRPQAESIVVLGRQNHQRDAGLSSCIGPLAGVEARWIEDGRAFQAGAPFSIGEGVDTKMEEHYDLSLLPFQLGI